MEPGVPTDSSTFTSAQKLDDIAAYEAAMKKGLKVALTCGRYVSAEVATQGWACPADENAAVAYPPGAITQVQMPNPPATPGIGGK